MKITNNNNVPFALSCFLKRLYMLQAITESPLSIRKKCPKKQGLPLAESFSVVHDECN